MDNILEKLFIEFGNDLQKVDKPSENRNGKERLLCERLERMLNDEQSEIFDELMAVMSDNSYEENVLSFASGLKLGIKISQIGVEPK